MTEIAGIAQYPVLAVPTEPYGTRDSLGRGIGGGRGPGAAKQALRLDSRFAEITAAMNSARLTIVPDISGQAPEMIIVLEVLATMDEFRKAVRHIPGLEFLAAIEEEGELAAEGFTSTREDGIVDKNLYILAQNSQALAQILRMWELWKADEKVRLEQGLAQWKVLFAHLKDVRVWGPQDRINGTQLAETWLSPVHADEDVLTAEVELWFRESRGTRDSVERAFIDDVQRLGGEILDSCQITEIAYHAILIRIPRSAANDVLSARGNIVGNPRVSYVRPQSIASDNIAQSLANMVTATNTPPPEPGEPLVAVLDGLPLSGHQRLAGRIKVDDPDNIDATVPAAARHHGSAVSSLVIWGDLEVSEFPIQRPILLHPIFSSTSVIDGIEYDSMDSEKLPVAMMHRLLERLFVGDPAQQEEHPVAPAVRVIVLAAGHTALPFGSRISPWARLLDVYAHRFGVLFIVSAGNYNEAISLAPDVPVTVLDDPGELRRIVRGHLMSSAHERRILSPADSMNGLTVGALHSDSVTTPLSPSAIDVIGGSNLPSPISALGGGQSRQLKPDFFADGGRVLHRHRWDEDRHITLDLIRSADVVPGLRVASPGQAGETDAERWMQGTSAATGFVGHQAAQVLEMLVLDGEDSFVDPRFHGVAVKALLVNTASWEDAETAVADAIPSVDARNARKAASRILSYGSMRPNRVALCTSRRITVVSTGILYENEARVLDVPLPHSLGGSSEWRRLSLTLAWFSPVNPRHRTYRQARVWFNVLNDINVGLSRSQADWQAARRGTVQHEIFEGTRAIAIRRGAHIRVKVNCAASAGGLSGAVPFSLVATFEVADTSKIRVYDEISAAIRASTKVRARAR